MQPSQATAEDHTLDDAVLGGVPRRIVPAFDDHLQQRQQPSVQDVGLRDDVDALGALPARNRSAARPDESGEISDRQPEAMSNMLHVQPGHQTTVHRKNRKNTT